MKLKGIAYKFSLKESAITIILALLYLNCLNAQQSEEFKRVAATLESPQPNTTLVVAHRADWRNHPENSLPGVKSCIAMGVDIVEIDVRITKDRKIVVIHDKLLDRTTTGKGKVSHHSLAEIKRLKLKNGYGVATQNKVPTLKEVLQLTKDKAHVMIDKAFYVLPEVWEIVKEVGVEDQVLFEGKLPLADFIQTYPKLIKEIRYMPRISPKTKDLDKYIMGYTSYLDIPMFITSFEKPKKDFLEKVAKLKNEGINVMATTLWEENAAGHTDDRALEQPEETYGWLIDKGFTAICTDRPQLVLDYLKIRNYKK